MLAPNYGYIVRRLEPTDATSLFQAVRASLAELSSMPWCTLDYALEDAQAWIEFSQRAWANRSEFPLGVFSALNGQVVGAVGIRQINKPSQMGNIGYWVGTPYVGRGIARFAAKHVAQLGFHELGLTRLEIVTLTHNFASQRVAAALGATREGVARNRLCLQGAPHDAVVYSLIPSDISSS
jgi:ribosomal-protein-serine acetyltransferase